MSINVLLCCKIDNNSRYNTPNNPGLPNWVHDVMPSPDPSEMTPFDLLPITPGTIKRILMKRPSNSSPGDDGISYHHLKKMPSTHHFLATLFSKILRENQIAPDAWCDARIKLIFKGGDNQSPVNFRPIALTSVVGKLFHKIIALRLEQFLSDNKIIDTSIQKGFLTNINGTMEHIFTVSAIVQNAIQLRLPLAMTFLDLANAFGSISHDLILDMISHCRLPQEISAYILSLYSKLTAYVKTKDWSTDKFVISRGVFQGDTLSPIIFLIAFNPIIQLAQSLPTCGFQLRIPNSSPETPKTNSYIYAFWDEPDSDEPAGWYLAKITANNPDGSVYLMYWKSKLRETIKLSEIKWHPTWGTVKWFRTSEDFPPNYTMGASKSTKSKGLLTISQSFHLPPMITTRLSMKSQIAAKI